MNRSNLMTLVAVMFVTSVCAQLAAETDLCTGSIDPYDIVSEKWRFYTAAGKDNELSATEFGAQKITSISFRRSFDRWSEMLKFDRDDNKSLDWMEAGAYRYMMRKIVLASYDANRDGKLAGSERLTACKAVASGKIHFPDKPSYTPLPPLPQKGHSDNRKGDSHKSSSKGSSHKSGSSKSDRRSNDGPSDAEKKARQEAQLRESQKKREEFEARQKEYEAKRNIAKFDKNKDGRLDGNEAAEREKHNSEQQARMSESKKRHDDMMRKYDKDGNGRIDDSERNALKEGLRQEAAKRAAEAKEASKKKMEEDHRRKEISKYDRNKDGKLDAEESAALDKYRAEQKQRMDDYLQKYDTNGDGQVSVEEKTAHRKEQEEKERQQKEARLGEKGKDNQKKDSDNHKPSKSKSKKKSSSKKGR